jgi:hypothetical protein
MILILISVRCWVGVIVEKEGLYQWKFKVTTQGIEPSPFWLVAQCLNQLRHRLPLILMVVQINLSYSCYSCNTNVAWDIWYTLTLFSGRPNYGKISLGILAYFLNVSYRNTNLCYYHAMLARAPSPVPPYVKLVLVWEYCKNTWHIVGNGTGVTRTIVNRWGGSSSWRKRSELEADHSTLSSVDDMNVRSSYTSNFYTFVASRWHTYL